MLGSLIWRAGEDVVLVGRAAHVAAIRAAGLNVEGVLGGFNATPHAVVPAAQLVSAVVGLHAEYVMAGHVMLVHAEGLLIGRPDGRNDELVERVRRVLDKAVPTAVTSNIRGARWAKLIMSLGNVLPVLCGVSAEQVYKDPFLRRLAAGLVREGRAVAERAGIRLAPPPGDAVPLASGRPGGSEPFNDEIVRRGKELHVPTPLNAHVVTLLQRAASGRHPLGVGEIQAALPQADLL